MDMFRGCINSTLEQLIKKKIMYPWTVPQEKNKRVKRKGRRKGEENGEEQ